MVNFCWFLIFLFRFIVGQKTRNCPDTSIYFDKVLGVRPPKNYSEPTLLYKLNNTNTKNQPVTLECIANCKLNKNCQNFVLYYNTGECYSYPEDFTEKENLKNSGLYDVNAAWFVKGCLESEIKCNKSWIFERIPGAVLIGNDSKILPTQLTRKECQQKCLEETEFTCRSVKYRINQNEVSNSETRGTCILSDADRHLLQSCYRVSTYDDEYFENQCSDSKNKLSNRGKKKEFCTYEEYENVTLAHNDFIIKEKTKEECQNLCESFSSFNCRGFSVVSGKTTQCLLTSEDSKVHGPKLLRESGNSNYYEKARCLDINVSCSDTFMTVKYNPETDFRGKIYMEGYSDRPECFAQGQGISTTVTLKLPLLTSQCGIMKADSPSNRTLISGTMVIQYNSLVQTQGDRVIKIGCVFGNESKVLLGTGLTVTSSPNKGSTILNTSSNETVAPVVEMRVIDLNSQEDTMDTQIGQELQLQIELKEKTDEYDIWASHLIAMTEKGDESIFLLDDRGCPTNLNIFPALKKTVTNETRKLYATFQAFKFASSPVVRFSVMVQFCPKECPAIDCGNNVESYGRRKREIKSYTLKTINGTMEFSKHNNLIAKMTNANISQLMSNVVNQMPLEYVMVVRDPKTSSDRYIVGDRNKVAVAGFDYSTNEICLNSSLVMGLLVTWILVQIVIIVCCIALVRRYKKYYEDQYLRASLEELHKNFGIGFSNLENRRVRWADNGDNFI